MMVANGTEGLPTNDTEVISEVECPIWEHPEDDDRLAFFKFINEGVLQVIISIFGIFGNSLSIYILTRDQMRNSFNFLLIGLLCFDSSFLCGVLLDMVRKAFFGKIFVTDIHTILFPYVFYPASVIFMTASICMTAAMALERFIAVHYPIDYNLSITSPEAIRLRLLRYLLPVIVFSIAFNIPKFMEAQTCWALKLNSTYATDLIQYDQDIQLDLELDVRNETFSSTKGTSFESYGSYVGSRDTTFPVCKHVFERWNTSNFHALYLLLHRDSIMDIELWRPMITTTKMRWDPNYAIYYNNWTRLLVLGIIPAGMLMYFNYKIYKDIKLRLDRRRQSTCGRVTANHQARRREEDNLALVFMGIVGMFLACHMLRIFLSMHEMIIIRDALACYNQHKRGFPVWAEITATFSTLFLVINSSTNMIIYCILNTQFREIFVKLVRGFLLRVSTEECRSFLGRINYCCPENDEGDDIQNSAVAMNTEYNRRTSNISNIRPTEIEMVGPDSANEKTKLFDGENNLKVISKPPNPPLNNASPSSSSHQPDNIANGDNNADNTSHPKVTEV